MMEDDVFDRFIEVDGEDVCDGRLLDDNKENQSVVMSIQPVHPVKIKAKKEQFVKIVDFLKDNNEALMDTDTYNQLWNDLTYELNALGPPSFSNVEWKRKWSDHKYNMKRKRSKVVPSDPLRQDERQQSHLSLDPVPVTMALDIDSENTRLLRILVEKQDVLIERQDAVIEKLNICVNLFEEISKKL